MSSRFAFAFLAFLMFTSTATLGQTKTVAFTVDDLPYAGASWQAGPISQQMAQQVNDAITHALKQHKVPATGFVIEQTVEELQPGSHAILRNWVKDGFELGNHTYSHAGLNDLTSQAFEADVLKGEKTFLPLMKEVGRGGDLFLRFPYNATGNTQEKHDAIAKFLIEHGYREAPCTIDNEDYEFNAAYMRSLRRHDEETAAKLREAYLAYTSEEIDYYARLDRAVLGYDPPQIMLIHDSKLNADTINRVIQLFVDKGYTFVSLKEAEADPIYTAPDTYVSQYGMMWGYRWAQERKIKLTGFHENEPPSWIGQYGKEANAGK